MTALEPDSDGLNLRLGSAAAGRLSAPRWFLVFRKTAMFNDAPLLRKTPLGVPEVSG